MNEPFRLNLKDGDLDYLKTSQVCKRYNITNKTLDKWKKFSILIAMLLVNKDQ